MIRGIFGDLITSEVNGLAYVASKSILSHTLLVEISEIPIPFAFPRVSSDKSRTVIICCLFSPHYSCAGFFSIPRGLIESDEYLWDSLTQTICKKGYEGRIGLQADFAADCYYNPENKTYQGLFNKEVRTREQQIEMILYLAREYPFVIMEDPLSEDDFEGHAYLTEKTGIQIVGDDLFSTNLERVKKGIETGACNTVLLKVNQVGTITEALEMVQLAYENGYGVMPCSSRGENLDICDYSVGLNAATIRESGLGSAGTRFLEIEAELGSRAKYAGKSGLKGWKFQCQKL
jgi:enolase